ncbi:MAG: hypothetical protein ACOZAJ_04390 [Patescibacteria group bacterium]
MDWNKFFSAKVFKTVSYAVACLVLLLAVFTLGTYVGYRKANFSYKWGDNYHRNFAGPRGGFMMDKPFPKPPFGPEEFMEGSGVFGQVIKVDSNQLVIRGRGDLEKIVVLDSDTVIKKFQQTISLSDIQIDDQVVIIGQPNNQGQIQAKLIRVMPKEAMKNIKLFRP